MKVKITDFLITMGKICNEHNENCFNCPFSVEEGNFYGCLKDDMSKSEHANMIKEITLNHMKEGRNNEF